MRALGGTGPINNLKLLDFSLRLCVLPLTTASICITALNQEENSSYGEVKFNSLGGLQYMAIAYLMVTSGAAVLEILYLAYHGDREVSWSEACGSYGRFCSRLKLALALHALSLCCFLIVAVISAYRVFSRFEPASPLPAAANKEVQTLSS